jgi:HlyD family secretion protein
MMIAIAFDRTAFSLYLSALLLAGCRGDEPDAYGNFEAEEVRVSAEVAGQLLRFDAGEGEHLPGGSVVGQIDTTSLALQRQELASQRGAARTRTTEAEAQIGVLQAQLATAQEEYERAVRLFRQDAATAQQLNQAEGEVRVLRERIRAGRAQTAGTREESGGAESRIEQLTEQIRKARIANPIAGTVLTTYVEAGEFVQPGQPLYTIADLNTLILRAYVSGAQLASLRIGSSVRVQIDAGADELMTLPGRVTWIAAQAEFTPTPIQTREERADQVYAVKISVANRNGVLKIGMPGEVVFTDSEGGDESAATFPASRPVAATGR